MQLVLLTCFCATLLPVVNDYFVAPTEEFSYDGDEVQVTQEVHSTI